MPTVLVAVFFYKVPFPTERGGQGGGVNARVPHSQDNEIPRYAVSKEGGGGRGGGGGGQGNEEARTADTEISWIWIRVGGR